MPLHHDMDCFAIATAKGEDFSRIRYNVTRFSNGVVIIALTEVESGSAQTLIAVLTKDQAANLKMALGG